MDKNNFIYTFSYNINESDVCKLESRQLFHQEEQHKVLMSDVKVEPSHSAFVKKRLDVLCVAESYDLLLQLLESESFVAEDFKVEYMSVYGDQTSYTEGLQMLSDVGARIQGLPCIQHPKVLFGLCHHDGRWYLGYLHKNNYKWKAHKLKPRSYSNSINIHLAKVLVNVATGGRTDRKLLDACCGVGTIMLEACFAQVAIEGCDINWRVCVQSRENLAHFNYKAEVMRSDIKDVSKHYDAAIIDLPYNLFSCADEAKHWHIISSAARVAPRVIIVSTSDISPLIDKEGLRLIDFCTVKKRGKKSFERKIWVCEH